MLAAKKVLVIDDDATACGLIEKVLTRYGIEVRISPGPRAGFEAAKAFIPDLIFVNLLLSDTNGLKMSKAIHAVTNLEKVPVIMLISHRGELDPKYTVTIGIIDTLVKPLNEAEIRAKTKAVLGDAAFTEPEDEMLGEISLEEAMAPRVLHEKDGMAAETELSSEGEELGKPVKKEDAEQGGRGSIREMTKEGESHMPEKENSSSKKEYDDRNLFSDESDIFGEELKKSCNEAGEQLQGEEKEDGLSEDEGDLSYGEEKPVNPVRRILLIAASIVAGIALGVGGYLFFTAGNQHAPEGKQVVRVLPEPAAVPAPPSLPSEKPKAIPEIPVTTEPKKAETAQAKEAKSQESSRIVEVHKTAPTAAAKSEEKELLPPKHADKKAQPAKQGKQAYYVQAGLFEKEANAKALAVKLRQKGYAPSVKKVESKDKRAIFRVTAGTYTDFKKAVEVSEALSRQGIKAIVRKQ